MRTLLSRTTTAAVWDGGSAPKPYRATTTLFPRKNARRRRSSQTSTDKPEPSITLGSRTGIAQGDLHSPLLLVFGKQRILRRKRHRPRRSPRLNLQRHCASVTLAADRRPTGRVPTGNGPFQLGTFPNHLERRLSLGTLRINAIGAREELPMGRLIAKEYQSMSVIVSKQASTSSGQPEMQP